MELNNATSPQCPLDVLIVAPHPDDAEIGAGGTILRCKQQGMRVGVVDLTNGEPTPHGTPAIRTAETEAATAILQLDWRFNLGLPNRNLEDCWDARCKLASVLRLTRPKVLLAPYWEDAHPDHVAASALSDTARFWAKLTKTDLPGQPNLDGQPHWTPQIFYFWSIHLRIHPKPAFVFDISDVIDRKMEAIRCYESQFVTGRSRQFPTILDDIRDRARYWGWTIGTAYAEPFASREEIGVSSLTALSLS